MGVADYVNRTVDVLAYQGATGRGSVLLGQFLADDSSGGMIVTGIQKLVQRFILILLTEKGSVTHFPDKGTEFMTDIRSGALRTPLDLHASFSSALVDVRKQLLDEELESDPDDEKFDSAEIISVSLSGDSASVTVQVDSVAGTTYQFIAPLSTKV